MWDCVYSVAVKSISSKKHTHKADYSRCLFTVDEYWRNWETLEEKQIDIAGRMTKE